METTDPQQFALADLPQQLASLAAAYSSLLERTSQAEQMNGRLSEQLERLQQTRTAPAPVPTREPKMEAPQKFAGESSRLRGFLAQLVITINAQPSRYQTEQQKCHYAVSLFTGRALEWIAPYAQDPDHEIFSDFAQFLEELKTVFGDVNEKAMAEHSLLELQQEGSKFTEYVTEFRRFQLLTRWDDIALTAKFYHGLSSAIKRGILSRGDRPTTLVEMIKVASHCDQNLREEQALRRAPTGSRSSAPAAFKSAPRPSASSSSGPTPMDLDATRSRPRAPLTEVERKYRRDNNLCSYCGQAGHWVRQCPNRRESSQTIAATELPPASSTEQGN